MAVGRPLPRRTTRRSQRCGILSAVPEPVRTPGLVLVEHEFAVPLDPASLALDKAKGVRIRPEHVHESLRELAGIADHPLSKRFPLGVPDKERLRGFWG